MAGGSATFVSVRIIDASAYSASGESYGAGFYVAGGVLRVIFSNITSATALVAAPMAAAQAMGGALFASGGTTNFTRSNIERCAAHHGLTH